MTTTTTTTCESGIGIGEQCDQIATTTVEWMPHHLRASHAAAGNSGRWPMNGSLRLRVCAGCAEMLADDDTE